MSDKQQRDMSGVLFKNDRKEKENHPDYKGSATINGEEVWISAWEKDGRKGPFMSLAFTKKGEPGSNSNRPKPPPPTSDTPPEDDDVPF